MSVAGADLPAGHGSPRSLRTACWRQTAAFPRINSDDCYVDDNKYDVRAASSEAEKDGDRSAAEFVS